MEEISLMSYVISLCKIYRIKTKIRCDITIVVIKISLFAGEISLKHDVISLTEIVIFTIYFSDI